MTIHKVQTTIEELQEVAKHIDETQFQDVISALKNAKRIYFSGMGRSGNMVKALAIRYMHLGYDAYVAGDAATPSIQKGDVLIAVSSSAKTPVTLNHIQVAKKQGAKVILISSLLENPKISDFYLCIPAKTIVQTQQHAGSLFEQSVLIVGDSIASELKELKHIDVAYMNARHANLQ